MFRRQTKIVMGSRRDADIVQKFRTRTQKFKTRITILHEDEMPTKTGGGMPEDWSQNAGDFDSRWTARRAEVSFSDCVSRWTMAVLFLWSWTAQWTSQKLVTDGAQQSEVVILTFQVQKVGCGCPLSNVCGCREHWPIYLTQTKCKGLLLIICSSWPKINKLYAPTNAHNSRFFLFEDQCKACNLDFVDILIPYRDFICSSAVMIIIKGTCVINLKYITEDTERQNNTKSIGGEKD